MKRSRDQMAKTPLPVDEEKQAVPASLHFISTTEDGNLEVYSFEPSSTPEGPLIYKELWKLWKRDSKEIDEKGYPKLLLHKTFYHCVLPVLGEKPDFYPDVVPDALKKVKDWGKWESYFAYENIELNGKVLKYDSWCWFPSPCNLCTEAK